MERSVSLEMKVEVRVKQGTKIFRANKGMAYFFSVKYEIFSRIYVGLAAFDP
jgi:hypothetical protein